MALETLNGVDKIGKVGIAHLDHPIEKEEWLETIASNYVIVTESTNTLLFKIQQGPVREAGENGCQVDTIIETARDIIAGLDKQFPSPYNKRAIERLNSALWGLEQRTLDRKFRGVEGTSAV